MISFRHHVVSLVAVFCALAIGVVLGGGPLADVGMGATKRLDQERARSTALQQESNATESALDYSGSLVRTLGDATLSSRLDGSPVTLVTMPGVDEELVTSLSDAVGAAGGSVTGAFAVQPTLLAPGEKSLVDTLSSQLAAQEEAAGVTPDASTYVRTGQLLGHAVATTDAGAAPADDAAVSIRESLQGAGLVTAPESETQVAPLVLVVLGDGGSADADPVVSGLLTGLRGATRGLVVAGSTESGTSGQLGRLREEEAEVGSTVDGIETGAGQVTAVLALAASHAGTTGDFGASGSDGTPPLG
ncbi:copper transporter [Nocardioides sp.]|uniref:copper transporter n=1 Tax=Nocardioides sp. TaxID=35761 RepID=UPI002733813D|nr:copper transporter [Nocardioides sp.]MDP3892881.1 copper transporter [Nocardioides sp.]